MKVRREDETKREGMRREMKGGNRTTEEKEQERVGNKMLTCNSVRFLLLDPMEKGTKHSVVWYLKYYFVCSYSYFMFVTYF